MNKLIKIFLFFPTVVTILNSANPAGSVEIFSRDNEHRGVIEFAPYQIYPENRIGNGIYLEKKTVGFPPTKGNS